MPHVINFGGLQGTSTSTFTLRTNPVGEVHIVKEPHTMQELPTVQNPHALEKPAPSSPPTAPGLPENWFSTAIWTVVAAILMPKIVPKL